MAREQKDQGLPGTDEMKGRVKQAAGSLTGDEDLEKEGRVDRTVSDVKEKIDSAAQKVKDLVRKDDDEQR